MREPRRSPRTNATRGSTKEHGNRHDPATGELLAHAAHVLKNHAAALQAAVHLILTHGDQADQAMRARWRQAARDAAGNLGRLLDQLERLGGALAPAPAVSSTEELAPWLRERVRIACAAEPAARASFAAGRAPAGRWRFATGPASVALDCLLRNALLHPPSGTRATLAARAVPGGLAFTVTDHGRGVPAGEKPQLFHPFFRGAAARDLPGAGLGLFLARAAARRAGGRVSHRDLRPRGARFDVVLPARRAGRSSSP